MLYYTLSSHDLNTRLVCYSDVLIITRSMTHHEMEILKVFVIEPSCTLTGIFCKTFNFRPLCRIWPLIKVWWLILSVASVFEQGRQWFTVHEMYFGILVQLGLVSRVVRTSGIFISVSGLFWRMAIWHVAFIEAVWHVAVGVAVLNRVSCTSSVDLKLKSNLTAT